MIISSEDYLRWRWPVSDISLSKMWKMWATRVKNSINYFVISMDWVLWNVSERTLFFFSRLCFHTLLRFKKWNDKKLNEKKLGLHHPSIISFIHIFLLCSLTIENTCTNKKQMWSILFETVLYLERSYKLFKMETFYYNLIDY